MDWLISPEIVTSLLGQALQYQVTQFGIAFSLAAWIHAGRVKKEINSQAGVMIAAMQDIASALRQDLAAQQENLGILGNRVDRIEHILERAKGE